MALILVISVASYLLLLTIIVYVGKVKRLDPLMQPRYARNANSCVTTILLVSFSLVPISGICSTVGLSWAIAALIIIAALAFVSNIGSYSR